MADPKKTIIVEDVIVKGYIKHANGRKTIFEFNKKDFTAKAFESIFEQVGQKF